MRRGPGVRPLISAVLATAAFGLGVWALVTPSAGPPAAALPEASGWLLMGALAAAALSVRDLTSRRLARWSTAMAVAAMVPAIVLLSRIPATIRRFDLVFQDVTSTSIADPLPDLLRDVLPARPFSVLDLFTGLPNRNLLAYHGVQYAGPNGAPLTLELYRPTERGTFPAIVLFEPAGSDRPSAALARALASARFVVIRPSVRPATEADGLTPQTDAHAALDWVRAHSQEYGLNARRIGVVGRFEGGSLALAAASGEPGVRAAVAWEPADAPFVAGDRPHPASLVIVAGRDPLVRARRIEFLEKRLDASGVSGLLVLPWALRGFGAVPFGPGPHIAFYCTVRFMTWALYSPSPPVG